MLRSLIRQLHRETGEVTLIGIEFSRETRNVSRFEWERPGRPRSGDG